MHCENLGARSPSWLGTFAFHSEVEYIHADHCPADRSVDTPGANHIFSNALKAAISLHPCGWSCRRATAVEPGDAAKREGNPC